MAGHYLKRWLYLTHRWIGIVSCIFFAMWFASGLVMLYVPYPSLERSEWLGGQQAIDWEAVDVAPRELPVPGGSSELRRLVLEMSGDAPVWRRHGWAGEEVSFSAVDGSETGVTGEADARQIAQAFAGAPVEAIASLHNDQWTVAGGYNRHRPLWKAEIAGEAGRTLYVSSQTGAVVLDTTRSERFWNWLGAVPHWIYPTVLRQDAPAWRQVVLWLSGPCIIAAITGIWIGLLRIRMGKRRFREGRMTPYRGWMWWHHVTGLAGGLFLLLWIFSGWMSMNPGEMFRSEGPAVEAQMRYAGTTPNSADLPALARLAPDARRVTFGSAAGQAYLRVEGADGSDRYLDPTTLAPASPGRDAILVRIAQLYPDNRIVDATVIERPDFYWYGVNREAPLPVLRVRLDDAAASWLHVELSSGEVVGSLDRMGRVYRWLYNLFHRWDANFLLENRPARDVLVWVFSIFGLITSIAGIRIGWARLRPRHAVARSRREGDAAAGAHASTRTPAKVD